MISKHTRGLQGLTGALALMLLSETAPLAWGKAQMPVLLAVFMRRSGVEIDNSRCRLAATIMNVARSSLKVDPAVDAILLRHLPSSGRLRSLEDRIQVLVN